MKPNETEEERQQRLERKREIKRKWRHANPEKMKGYAKRQKEKDPGALQRWRKKNPDKVKEHLRRQRKRDPQKHVRRQRKRDPQKHVAAVTASRKKNWSKFLDRQKEQCRKARTELRAKVIAALGGKCVHCGYDKDQRALQIDHIAGDGAIERKTKGYTQWSFYKRVAELGHQDRYQLLCANCNFIKRLDEGAHPRQGRKTIPVV